MPDDDATNKLFPQLDPTLAMVQDVPGKNISPFKLLALLRIKFGAGAYDIQVFLPTNIFQQQKEQVKEL